MIKLNWLNNFAEKTSQNQIISAIRSGLLLMMPLVFIGSIVLTLLNLPVAVFQEFMYNIFGEIWRDIALSIFKGTFRIIAITTLICISYSLAGKQEEIISGQVNVIIVVIVSFSCFIALTKETETVISYDSSGSTGIFTAIVVAVTSTYLFMFFYRHQPNKVRAYTYDADSLLVSTLRTIGPALLTILTFAIIKVLFSVFGSTAMFTDFYKNFFTTFHHYGGELLTAILYSVVTHILWFFGLHGTNIMDGVAKDLFVTASNENINLVFNGLAAKNIFTKEFFDLFVYIGGCGATLGLLAALLLFSKRSNMSRIAKYSLFSGIFNVNEIMVYGLPIIFNPYYLIPFLFTPVVLCITTYMAMELGIVPLTVSRVEWTTPIFLSGYISTGRSIAGILMQLFNLALSVVIYLPFIRLYENNMKLSNMRALERMQKNFGEFEQQTTSSILSRNDEVGALAREIAGELQNCLDGKGTGQLYLKYQPKVDCTGKIIGAEALLRFNHPVCAEISPLLTIAIAQEAKLSTELGRWVFNNALNALHTLHTIGFDDMIFSVNLSPKQLKEDDGLLEFIENKLAENKINPSLLEIELTEDAAIDQSQATKHRLELIRQTGINISIDDFGMGNSSLLYLRDFYANVIKLDITLARHVTTDKNTQEIVRSISQLCEMLNVSLIAEGVETIEQVLQFESLGCNKFQGYYFSRPLAIDDFIEYMNKSAQQENLTL